VLLKYFLMMQQRFDESIQEHLHCSASVLVGVALLQGIGNLVRIRAQYRTSARSVRRAAEPVSGITQPPSAG
jgi:hypothetical protein